MNWTQPVDAYCERIDASLFSEPLNAITNLAFILGALWLWPRVKGDTGAIALSVSLFSIGIASGLFHTIAQRWAGAADSISILIFILIYIYLATHRMLGTSKPIALLAVLLFFPFAFASASIINAVFGPLNGSVAYLPVIILIAAYAIATRTKPTISKGLWIGVALLAISLTMRTLDQTLCDTLPYGTHLFWHIFNGLMLTHMTYLMTRHARPLASMPRGS